MTTQEIEQVVLAITQVSLLFNQFFLSKRMSDGMTRMAGTKSKVDENHDKLKNIESYLIIIESKIGEICKKRLP